MPLFFFIAGYSYMKYTARKNLSFLGLATQKFRRLILPYLAISSFAFPLKAFLSSFALREMSFDYVDFFNQFLFPWDNVIIFFWFLPTLFFITMIVHALSMKKEKFYLFFIVALSIKLMSSLYENIEYLKFMNISGVLSNLVYFALGGIVFQKDSVFFRHKNLIALIPLSGILFCLLPPIFLQTSFFSFLFAVIGIFGAWSFAQNFHIGFLEYVGNYNYPIYLFSWFPQIFVRILFDQILHVNFYLVAFLMFVVGLVVPVGVVYLLQKRKFSPLVSDVLGLNGLPDPREALRLIRTTGKAW